MGIFDRTTKGQTAPKIEVTLERGALIFFAETIGETNPIHLNAQAAQAAGHPDILAPPTYGVVVGTLADHSAARQGLTNVMQLINADYRVLLHGSETYDYHAPMFAGETVLVENEVTDFTDVTRAGLEIAHVTCRITHATRGPLITATRAMIHQLG